MLFSILAAILLIGVPNYLYDDLSNLTLCTINDREIGFIVYLANFLIATAIPFLIMLLSTCIILNYLITQKIILEQNHFDFSREKNFIKSVLTMDLWFLICYTPFCVFCVLRYTHVYIETNNDELWRLIFDLFALLALAGVSCNFFVYYFCNRLFREYFLSMIGRCRN
jgi:hypothetical protein